MFKNDRLPLNKFRKNIGTILGVLSSEGRKHVVFPFVSLVSTFSSNN